MDSIARPNNRSFIEKILQELTGGEWSLKLELAENLPNEPTPAEQLPHKSYQNDPLIRQALDLFQGEIKSVTNA